MNICILLATYNGEKFLNAQLNSLIHQTEKEWICLIRDDGSQDKTIEIINEYCLKDSRFILISDDLGPQGNAMANFSLLIEAGVKTDADYFFFSDQDDVWANNKLEFIAAEFKKKNIQKPLLIHHDLEVVNHDLSQLSPSFIHYSALEPSASFARLLSRNVVTGCASACNRELLELSLPLPKEALMHDWWLALTASYFGELHFINKVLIKYRQHENNVLGANSFKQITKPFRPFQSIKKGQFRSRFKRLMELSPSFYSTLDQAGAFLNLINSKQEVVNCQRKKNFRVLVTYSNLLKFSKLKRISSILYFGFLQKNLQLKIRMFIKFIFYSSKEREE